MMTEESSSDIAHTHFGTDRQQQTDSSTINQEAHLLDADDVNSLAMDTNASVLPCGGKPLMKPKPTRLNKKQMEELQETVYLHLLDGIPPAGIAVILDIKEKRVREIMGELLMNPETREIPPSKFEVIGTGFKIKDIAGSSFDECDYVRVDRLEDGSITIKPFVVGESHE